MMTVMSRVDETSTRKPIQVNPLHAEMIVRQIMNKPKWHSKLSDPIIVSKWKKESSDQGISKSSFSVAIEILEDIKSLSKCKKSCCGHCGANPKMKKWDDPASSDEEDGGLFSQAIAKKKDNQDEPEKRERKMNEDEQDDDDEEDEDELRFLRATKFCLCPCAHCAFVEEEPCESVCIEKEGLIPKELTERLKKHLNDLVESTPIDKLDWHPGSNQQVLDIIHPSLYCYSKAHSILNDNSKYIDNDLKSIETQWLPTEFQVDRKDKSVKPLSYINNINSRTQVELQNTICEVLSHFIEPVSKFVSPIDDKIQVIIKAANVIVTPEQGFYPGGTWHTEGDTENIVATGIFYYECQNVKESFLEFRTSLNEENFYGIEQDNVQQAWDEYGVSVQTFLMLTFETFTNLLNYNNQIHDGDSLFEVLGRVKTTEGKCIIFPNTNQHRVRHFFPKDPSKIATRKILVFFFVDPLNPIVSTSDIDNQRRDTTISNIIPLSRKITFPVLVKNVIPFLPLWTKEQAEKVREKLMENRKYKRDNENELYERDFSLCEH